MHPVFAGIFPTEMTAQGPNSVEQELLKVAKNNKNGKPWEKEDYTIVYTKKMHIQFLLM